MWPVYCTPVLRNRVTGVRVKVLQCVMAYDNRSGEYLPGLLVESEHNVRSGLVGIVLLRDVDVTTGMGAQEWVME